MPLWLVPVIVVVAFANAGLYLGHAIGRALRHRYTNETH